MRLLGVACAIVIALPRVAAGEGSGVIAIGPDRTALSRAVGQAIDPNGRVVIDGVEAAREAIVAGAVPAETLVRFRRVREQIDEGWRAYLRVQFEFAQSRLASARTEAEGLVALPGGAVLYADAALRLGVVLTKIGRAEEAQAVLALALAMDPERPITFAEFAPDIVAAVDAVRALVQPSQRVRIVSATGALIAVDGKEVGKAPVEVELARGQHVVVARGPQLVARAQAVAVDAATREISIELERDEVAVRLASGASVGMDELATRALADAVLTFADLDELYLVVDTDRRGGAALFVQRCVPAPTRCSAIVELGYGDRAGLPVAAKTAIADARAATPRVTASLFADARVIGNRGPERCEICRSPWLWGGVGVAALVGTIAVVALVSGSKPAPIVTGDPGDFMRH